MTEGVICPNQEYGKHIVVRCQGCGSHHSTKNIGSRDPETLVAGRSRGLFDSLDETCSCQDPAEYPVVHNCSQDDTWKKPWERDKKEQEEARK